MEKANKRIRETDSVKANKRLREGDRVIVIAGNDKGRTGEVLSRKGSKLVIQGVNIRKKHARKTQEGPGRILSIEMPVNASNVMLCPEGEKAVKLFCRTNKEGEQELCYKDGDKEVVYRSKKKNK